MKLTLEEAVGYHRKMWDAIAEEIRKHGVRYKNAQILKQVIRETVFPELEERLIANNCFLCEFTMEREEVDYGDLRDCGKCPLMKVKSYHCLSTAYPDFYQAYGNDERYRALRLAREIAAMPVVNPLYKERGTKL